MYDNVWLPMTMQFWKLFHTLAYFFQLLKFFKQFKLLHDSNVLTLFISTLSTFVYICLPLLTFVYLSSNYASMHKFCACFFNNWVIFNYFVSFLLAYSLKSCSKTMSRRTYMPWRGMDRSVGSSIMKRARGKMAKVNTETDPCAPSMGVQIKMGSYSVIPDLLKLNTKVSFNTHNPPPPTTNF